MNQVCPYPGDTIFRAKARNHQSDFREKVLGIDFDANDPHAKFGNLLPKEAALQGLIFYEGYRCEIIKISSNRYGRIKPTPLYTNLLRSEHIPLNIFGPMYLNPEKAKMLFSEIINEKIKSLSILIEYAGQDHSSFYLADRTSFDVFVSYHTTTGSKGGIGIEVKYTEEGYRIGSKELHDINNSKGLYAENSVYCGYFINPQSDLLKSDLIRQLWRNHILGASMIRKGDIQSFHYIHIYPKGNIHFDKLAIPEYEKLLTEKGKDSFLPLTYERLFELMEEYFTDKEGLKWIDYLKKRYIV